jgi:hypothetical protein
MIDDLVLRAMRAYRIAEAKESGLVVHQQPSNRSRVVEHNGLRYVVLVNVSGVIAVYRVRTDNGLLRRLKRWPVEIE